MFEAAVGLPVRAADARIPGAPRGAIIRYNFAAAAALSGDVRRASLLLGDDDILPDSLPLVEACRALISATRGGGSRAEAMPMSSSSPMGEFLGFGPSYLRGVAYLRAGDGAYAAAEFGRIIEHRGVHPTSPFYPLAYVERARAHVMENDLAQARRDYETFFALWANADAGIPILRVARAEYAKLDGADRMKKARH
jgi:hypothetical protein